MTPKEQIQNHINNNYHNSYSVLQSVESSIKERKFHQQIHILYDLVEFLDKEEIYYIEIGSYVGTSANLVLSNNKVKKVICIDPLNLSKSHFCGALEQEQTLKNNLAKFDSKRYSIMKGFSTDQEIINNFTNKTGCFDLLFIDGDHSYQGVLDDFNNYEHCVRRGGFIVFDDYFDHRHSPDVKKSVDYLCSLESVKKKYDIIGTVKAKLSQKLQRDYGEFILRKKQ